MGMILSNLSFFLNHCAVWRFYFILVVLKFTLKSHLKTMVHSLQIVFQTNALNLYIVSRYCVPGTELDVEIQQ